ncbi:ribonuclease P protein subunit p38 [Eudromia elegans]
MPVIQRGTASLRKAKKVNVKICLDDPYVIQWKTIDGEDMHFILQTLEEKIKDVGLKKIEAPRKKRHSATKRRKERKGGTGSSKPPTEKETEGARPKPGWSDPGIRRQLTIGINEATKALEKKELALLLVCKSAKPDMITSHLIALSASRATPAGQVPRLSDTVAPLLGLGSVLALGFKRQSETFAAVAEAIIPKIPALEVPWIVQDGAEPSVAGAGADALEGRDAEQPEQELAGQKRKRAEGGRPGSARVVLQPLRIKKLLPNPNKIRKPPRKKRKALSVL